MSPKESRNRTLPNPAISHRIVFNRGEKKGGESQQELIYKNRYKKSRFNEFNESSRGAQDPKFRTNSSSKRNGSHRSIGISPISLLEGVKGCCGPFSDHICCWCWGWGWDCSSHGCGPGPATSCSVDSSAELGVLLLLLLPLLRSGILWVLRADCFVGVDPRFGLFSSDNCRYSAVLSSKQWKKISNTQ